MFRLLLLFVFVVPFITRAQDKDEEMITWKAGKELTWEDYKGAPNPASSAAASTTTYLGIEYSVSPVGFTYTISSRFSRTKSWGRHKTDHVLAHEQGHFDIAEVFARQLNKAMAEYTFNKSSYKNDLKAIYDRVLEGKEAMQNNYDDQTNHSINREKQAEWRKKIDDLLETTKKYAGY